MCLSHHAINLTFISLLSLSPYTMVSCVSAAFSLFLRFAVGLASQILILSAHRVARSGSHCYLRPPLSSLLHRHRSFFFSFFFNSPLTGFAAGRNFCVGRHNVLATAVHFFYSALPSLPQAGYCRQAPSCRRWLCRRCTHG